VFQGSRGEGLHLLPWTAMLFLGGALGIAVPSAVFTAHGGFTPMTESTHVPSVETNKLPSVDEIDSASPQARFDDLVVELLGTAGVTPPGTGNGFGHSALRINGKIFAMLVRGRLVLKLPAERVTALVDDGHGERFDANKRTPMRQWLSLDPDSGLDWLALAREALGFVGG
jgi:hypothetical protein